MPSFDPFADQDVAALTALLVALEARVASLERALAVGLDGSITIAARGQLKLSSQRDISLSVGAATAKLDANVLNVTTAATQFNATAMAFNTPVVNIPFGLVRCDNLVATSVTASGRRL
jgi:hypothetical protein